MGNFDVILEVKEDSDNLVNLKVFDEDFGKDDTMGQTQIDIESILTARTVNNKWISLKDCKSGQVLISAEFVPFGESRTIVEKEVNKMDTTIQKPPQVSDSKEKIMSDKKDSRPTSPEQISARPISPENLPSRPISPESVISRPISPQKIPSTPGTPVKLLSRPVSPGVEIQERK